MRLSHLGLPVRDGDRSQLFYATYFGFDPATAQTYPDGTVIIRNADGFDLALHATQDTGAPQPFLHFGFRLAGGDDVRAALARVRGPSGRNVVRPDGRKRAGPATERTTGDHAAMWSGLMAGSELDAPQDSLAVTGPQCGPA